MSRRKAQVAAEFLATYGWALFGLFMLVAILLGTGFVNAGQFTGEDCTAQPGLGCTSYYLKSTGPASLELGAKLTNLLGYPVYIKNVSVAYAQAGSNKVFTCNSIACGAANYSAPSDADVIRVQMAPVNRVPDQITPFYMTIYYRSCQDFNTSEQCAGAKTDLYPYHKTTLRLYLNTRHG